MLRGKLVLALPLAVALATGFARHGSAEDCSGVGPWINEFDYDDNSAGGVQDTDEFVEIAAPAGTDISGYQVLAIEGNPSLFLPICGTGLGGVQEGESYFTGTVPAGTIIGDDTGTGVGFFVMCFVDTSTDIGADCDVTVPAVASDSNLKNGNLLNSDPTNCPDGVLLLDPANDLADAISWEGIVPNQGPYGALFNAPNPSYNAGRDVGTTNLESFEKTSGVGRALSEIEWALSGTNASSPGVINAGQVLVCDAAGVCGNGVLDAGEACDDGGTADGDCCSSTCTYEPPGSVCDDGDACTAVDTCDGAGTCLAGAAVVCDDGAFCNGVETCDPGLGCQPGTPVDPDDGVACTDDVCDEGADVVVNTPNDAYCDDLQFCNGAETCDALAGCQPGSPVDPDDGVACTDDACDEGADVVVNTPNDAHCDDGNACTAGLCDAVSGCSFQPIPGCVATQVPATPLWARILLAAMFLAAGGMLKRLPKRTAA
jgi:cysteine-rich repeat protein